MRKTVEVVGVGAPNNRVADVARAICLACGDSFGDWLGEHNRAQWAKYEAIACTAIAAMGAGGDDAPADGEMITLLREIRDMLSGSADAIKIVDEGDSADVRPETATLEAIKSARLDGAKAMRDHIASTAESNGNDVLALQVRAVKPEVIEWLRNRSDG